MTVAPRIVLPWTIAKRSSTGPRDRVAIVTDTGRRTVRPAPRSPGAPRVVIESPYAGDVAGNVAYARAAVADSLRRGEAPIASHLLHTQPGILDDGDLEQRNAGIEAGHAWIGVADLVAAYVDRGVSAGMVRGLHRAHAAGVPVQYRTIGGW